MSSIKAAIRLKPEIIKQGHFDLTCSVDSKDLIYNKIMRITGGDHEVAADAESWCELASIGEIYEFREGQIEIVEY